MQKNRFRLSCLAAVILAALMLSACGQTGPLYLPGQPSPSKGNKLP